jgi:hypothetical protein
MSAKRFRNPKIETFWTALVFRRAIGQGGRGDGGGMVSRLALIRDAIES